MKITAKVIKDIDPATFRKLRRQADLNGKVVNVGIPQNKYHRERNEQGKLKRITKKAIATGKAILIAVIGAIHEFGAPERGIPARPWLRPGIRSGTPDYIRLNRVNLLRIMQGKLDRDTALKQLGVMAVGKVQAYIRQSNHFKPLKPSTIKAKGSSAPLIDTAQLIQSIQFELVDKP